MAADGDRKDGSSTLAVILSTLLALAAAGVVYYYHDQAARAEETLAEAKDNYRKMADRMKKPVEEYLRTKKSRPAEAANNVDMMPFLDRKAREAQIPPGLFNLAKNAGTHR